MNVPAASILFLLLSGCDMEQSASPPGTQAPDAIAQKPPAIGAIPVPAGYQRVAATAGSFLHWLRAIPLKEDKTVYLFNGAVKPNQSAQYAVIDIPVGKKDLQQCADVVMRLRAEYLFAQGRFGEISFMDYSHKWYPWKGGNNRAAFEPYLLQVFGMCGSASLEKQLRPVPAFASIQAGDVLVKGGFPGHAVIVADMAMDARGRKLFLLVQGYQPAQDMHVLLNPSDPSLSPWYELPEADIVQTPEWTFTTKQLRRW